MTSKDTREDSFWMSGLTNQGNLPSDEMRWKLFPNKRISTQSSSQTQAIGKFLLLLGQQRESKFNEKIMSFMVT